jgi:hypothetical protein
MDHHSLTHGKADTVSLLRVYFFPEILTARSNLERLDLADLGPYPWW